MTLAFDWRHCYRHTEARQALLSLSSLGGEAPKGLTQLFIIICTSFVDKPNNEQRRWFLSSPVFAITTTNDNNNNDNSKQQQRPSMEEWINQNLFPNQSSLSPSSKNHRQGSNSHRWSHWPRSHHHCEWMKYHISNNIIQQYKLFWTTIYYHSQKN